MKQGSLLLKKLKADHCSSPLGPVAFFLLFVIEVG